MQDPLAVSYKGQEGSGLAQVLPKSSFDVSEASKEMFEKTFAFELKKQQERQARQKELFDSLDIKMKDVHEKKKLEILNEYNNLHKRIVDVRSRADSTNTPVTPKEELELTSLQQQLQSKIDSAHQQLVDINDFVQKAGQTPNVDITESLQNAHDAVDDKGNVDYSKLKFGWNVNLQDEIQKGVLNEFNKSKQDIITTLRDKNAPGGTVVVTKTVPLKSERDLYKMVDNLISTNPKLKDKYNSPEGRQIAYNIALNGVEQDIKKHWERDPQTQDNSFQIFGGGIKARRVPSRSGDPVYTIQTYNQISVKPKKALVNASILTNEQGNKYGPSTDQVEFIPMSKITVPYYNGKEMKSILLTLEDQETYKAPGGVMYIYPGEPLPEFNNPSAYSNIIPNNEITLEDEILGVTPLGEGQYATVTAKTEDVGWVLKTNTDTKGRKILESTIAAPKQKIDVSKIFAK